MNGIEVLAGESMTTPRRLVDGDRHDRQVDVRDLLDGHDSIGDRALAGAERLVLLRPQVAEPLAVRPEDRLTIVGREAPGGAEQSSFDRVDLIDIELIEVDAARSGTRSSGRD